MVEGIKAALDFPHNPSRYRFVSFMTDGYIGNEAEILAEVHRRISNARIFSFGVGELVNRYVMERMAKVGRGAVAYLGLNDSAEEVMGAFFERVSRAALIDVEVDWGGMTVSDTYSSRTPDLFVGRPLVVAGRFRGKPAQINMIRDSAWCAPYFRGRGRGSRQCRSVPRQGLGAREHRRACRPAGDHR